MSLQVEKLEKNMAKLTIEVPAEEFDAAIKNAYNKNKNKFSIPGFRKGKAPLAMLEKMYGAGIFYEDAANEVIDASYPKAAEESKEEIVSTPEIKVTQIEKGKAFIYEATVALKPEVTLGEYKGVEVKKAEAVVTDEDVENELTAARKKNGRLIDVEDGAIEDGDNTIIDFTGYIDDKTFDGGAGTDYPLVIGSHSFIDTFEDQLVGKNTGDEVEVNVTFPKEYHAEDLAGKPAVFKVKINEIKTKELPELNDEFASDVSEFETLEEYKESMKKNLEETKENNAKRTKEDEAIKKIIEKSEMEIPDAMIESQVQNMIQEFAQRLAQQGLSFDQYMQFSGMTMDKMKEQVRPEALTRIQSSLVLEQIAKEENFEITEDDVNAEIEKMAKAYGMEADKLKEYVGDNEKESMKRDIAIEKAVQFIMDNVKERAKAKTKKEKEAEAANAEA